LTSKIFFVSGADYFSGPGRAVHPVCLCVWTITKMPFDLDIWHAGSH